ncbi:MAG TPA: hypothetical protein VGD18_03045 [Thiobacillaceae bacterium]
MDADKIAAVAGTLGLVHGGFSRVEQTHPTQMGAMAPVTHKRAARAPVRTGLEAIATGVRQFFSSRRR